MEINTLSAICFVFLASGFLVVLYKLMSYWFVELLVVVFCIGGVEVPNLFFSSIRFLCILSVVSTYDPNPKHT